MTIKKPLLSTVALDWLRYMNAHNQEGGRTPLTPDDIARVFAYVQLVEGRLIAKGEAFNDLREHVGLGAGPDGKGMPDRRTVRNRLRRIERRHIVARVEAQRVSWRGTLPVYTVRFERSEERYLGSIDEMPGVVSQGRTLAAAMASLTDCVRLAVRVHPQRKRTRSKSRARTQRR